MARETLELSVARQAERQHVLERRKAAARTTEEREELAVLRRNEACLKSLRGFDEAAEAEDERGRRRLCGWGIGAVVPPARGGGGTM